MADLGVNFRFFAGCVEGRCDSDCVAIVGGIVEMWDEEGCDDRVVGGASLRATQALVVDAVVTGDDDDVVSVVPVPELEAMLMDESW